MGAGLPSKQTFPSLMAACIWSLLSHPPTEKVVGRVVAEDVAVFNSRLVRRNELCVGELTKDLLIKEEAE